MSEAMGVVVLVLRDVVVAVMLDGKGRGNGNGM
jgi:hypothetical protein